ncbi:MAG: ATP-binding protein [Bacteroidota bacterium]
MTQSLTKAVSFLRNLGVDTTQYPLEQERIRLINDTFLVGILIELMFTFYLSFWLQLERTTYIYRIIFYLLFLLLNQLGYIKTVRFSFIILLPILLLLAMLNLGNIPIVNLFFVVFPAIVLVLLANQIERVIFVLYVVLLYLYGDIYNDFYPSELKFQSSGTFLFAGFVGIVVLGYIYISRFTKAKAKVIRQLRDLSNHLNTQNEMLTQNQQKILSQQQTLEKSNKELENFAYIASHDLKTPLRNITNFLHLIKRKLNHYPDQNIHEYLELAHNSAKKMHYLVEDTLEFSRLNRKGLKLQQVDLNRTGMIVRRNLREIMEQKNGQIIIDENLPTIRANETQMMILFQNLAENGLKYNESKTPTVTIKNNSTSEAIVLHFQDNGLGISEKYYDRIFKMFERLHSNADYQGSGLGLAICKKIVAYYDGKIEIQSKTGQGTVFVITIPQKN